MPPASCATHVTVVVPRGKVCGEVIGVLPILQTTEGGVVQLSVAVGVAKATEAVHLLASVGTVMLAGQVIFGASRSLTVTVKLHVPVRPESSVAEQVTVVVPTAKVCGEVIGVLPILQTTGGLPQLSVAVGVANVTEALHLPASVGTVISAGQVSFGNSISRTDTLKLHVAPEAELQWIVVVPTGKNVPEGGSQVIAPVAPNAVGAGKFTTAPHLPGVLSARMSPGHSIRAGTPLPVRSTSEVPHTGLPRSMCTCAVRVPSAEGVNWRVNTVVSPFRRVVGPLAAKSPALAPVNVKTIGPLQSRRPPMGNN